MKSIFTLALIGAVAYAAQEDDNEEEFTFLEYEYGGLGSDNSPDDQPEEDFNDYLARCNKVYDTNREYKMRKSLWKKAVKKIAQKNAANTAA